jgi:hypothetical protein
MNLFFNCKIGISQLTGIGPVIAKANLLLNADGTTAAGTVLLYQKSALSPVIVVYAAGGTAITSTTATMDIRTNAAVPGAANLCTVANLGAVFNPITVSLIHRSSMC